MPTLEKPTVVDGFEIWAPELAHGHDGFTDHGHEALDQVEDDYFWFQCRRRLLADLLQARIPRDGSYAEVGCGNGGVLSAVADVRPDLQLTGIEASLAGLAHARRRVPRAHLLQADATRLPFTGEFDAMGIYDVLEHIDDDHAVLQAMHRALKPDGLLLVTVPQHRWLWSWVDEASCHRRRYDRAELATKLEENGFEPLAWSSYLVWLMPMLWASRWHKPANPTAPKLPAPVNGLLAAITGAETLLTRAGWDHRWGGSMISLARRR